MLKDGIALAAPRDCTPLLTLLDDASASEDEFAESLQAALRGKNGADPSTGPIHLPSPAVMDVWEKLDRGRDRVDRRSAAPSREEVSS